MNSIFVLISSSQKSKSIPLLKMTEIIGVTEEDEKSYYSTKYLVFLPLKIQAEK